MEENQFGFTSKDELLNKLRSYSDTPDDDNIRIKKKIEDALIQCPELLYALNNKELESELFNEDGSLNTEGEWDRYYGQDSNIRPFLYIPESQDDVNHFVCFQTYWEKRYKPGHNPTEKYFEITFTILVNGRDAIDELTGIARHDLISSILRERFNWSNLFGTQCHISENIEGITDTHYLTRTLTIQLTLPNDIVTTTNGVTSTTNFLFRR